jgi:hypothetical protein
MFYRSFDTITEFYESVIYHWIKMSVQLTIIIVLNVYNNVKVSRLESSTCSVCSSIDCVNADSCCVMKWCHRTCPSYLLISYVASFMASSNEHLIYHRHTHSTSCVHAQVWPTRAKPPANIFLSIFHHSSLWKLFITSVLEYQGAAVMLYPHLSPVVHNTHYPI